ncbi:MAG: DNA methyltransferase, partial [Promethearchaeota archaeon]
KIKVFSDFIDYWAIDYDYKDNKFNNMWTSFRIPKKRKLDLESDPYLYEKSGEYNLSVKIIDIFGTELVNSYKIRI